jgi:heme/copper-type cytochrome/quinol oxidase subunit 2
MDAVWVTIGVCWLIGLLAFWWHIRFERRRNRQWESAHTLEYLRWLESER